MKAVTAVCAVLLLCGCSGRPATDSDQAGQSGNQRTSPAPCHQPLSVYCEEVGCRDYARSLAAACRGYSSRSSLLPRAAGGECGGLRFTRFANGFGSVTEYFDASGKLVAAFTTTDGIEPNSPCPDWKAYGPPIDCKRVDQMDACGSASERNPPRRSR
jgi:hypothetical protein